jgi:ABC-type glycerol-3-phosphate transport system substrate-binding protein
METKKKISRRDFMRLAGMAAGATAIAACTTTTPTPQVIVQTSVVTQVVKETAVVQQTQVVQQVVTPTPKPIKLNAPLDSGTEAVHQAATKAYQATHPYFSMNWVAGGYQGALAPMLAAGTAPDFMRMDISSPSQYGTKNLLMDWAPTLTNMGAVSQFLPAMWRNYLTSTGQMWQMPTDTNTFCMWSNPDVLKNAGVTKLPVVWQDLLDASHAIYKPDPDPKKTVYGFGIPTTIAWSTFFMYWWLWREGGDYYDGQKLIFKDAMTAALTKVRFLITDNDLPSEDNWQADYWYKGQLGFEEFGQWMIPADIPGPWNDNTPKGTWTGATPRPTFTISPMIKLEAAVPNYTIMAGFGYITPKTAQNYFDEVASYCFYEVSDPVAGQMWVTPYNQIPVIPAIKHPWLDTPAYQGFIQQLAFTKPFPVWPEIVELVNNEWVSPILDALSGKAKPDAAVQRMLDLGNPVVAEYQALR